MKKLLIPLAFAILACSIPVRVDLDSSTASPTPDLTPSPIPTLQPTADPGTEQNPLILALAPSPRANPDMNSAGELIAARLSAQTGYRIVVVAPSSESGLIESFAKGDAHIASFTPFGYLLAREDKSAAAILASARNNKAFYGTQFIIHRDSEFSSYFDATRNENTADAAVALKQFQDKKPCWSDAASPSAYVMPLGLLNQAQVEVRSGAFLEGQPSVVRAVYADDICDFGATFIDARESPTLEADYPDVMDLVHVAWRSTEIIPYDNIAVSTTLPFEMRRVIQRAFIDLSLTPEGLSAIQTVYGMDELQVVEDSAYDAFAQIALISNLSLIELIEK